MKYSREEIQQYIVEEEVKFIRMAFCDIYGKQKNISIMADEFGRAYEHGIAIDASAVPGFGDVVHSENQETQGHTPGISTLSLSLFLSSDFLLNHKNRESSDSAIPYKLPLHLDLPLNNFRIDKINVLPDIRP